MLRNECVEVESVWAGAGAGVRGGANERGGVEESCREIDRQLRRIAKRKAGLEIEEARWLREAEQQRIWRKLGFSTALEYLEDVFGYSPRTAMDRLRVAKVLAELPALEAAVRDGGLPYSAARELTRVMTKDTEEGWLASARGRNLREIEELVAGRKKGDKPDSRRDPDLIKRRRVLELSPRVDAMFEQCRSVLAEELGSHVDEDVLVEALCRYFLAGGGAPGSTAEDEGARAQGGTTAKAKAPRPAHRIVIYKCESCARAWQQGRGRTVELTADEIALAECDGETVHWSDESCLQLATPQSDQRAALDPGRTVDLLVDEQGSPQSEHQSMLEQCRSVDRLVDAPATPQIEPRSMPRLQQRITPNISQRATPNIPQRIRNLVWARDGGRCRVPGCRATRCLDIHHIHPRCEGGDHDPSNLLVLCSGHHKLHHSGLLAITGRAPDQLTFVRDGTMLVDARSTRAVRTSHALRKHAVNSKFAEVTTREHAKQALVNLGFKARAAGQALDEVRAHVGTGADVSTLVKAALARGGTAQATDDDLPQLARQALVQLGFTSAIATRAVEAATAHVGTTADLGALIKEALRWCR